MSRVKLVADPGGTDWLPITMANGAVASEAIAPLARKMGGLGFIFFPRLERREDRTLGDYFAVLPTEVRPNKETRFFAQAWAGEVVSGWIRTNGQMCLAGSAPLTQITIINVPPFQTR